MQLQFVQAVFKGLKMLKMEHVQVANIQNSVLPPIVFNLSTNVPITISTLPQSVMTKILFYQKIAKLDLKWEQWKNI